MAVGGFKRIEKWTDEELNLAIQEAIAHCASAGLDFWLIHRGIFGYLEQRKRKDQSRKAREDEVQAENIGSAGLARKFEND